MCDTLQGFHEHYSRMAIVGVTSELLVVLGFWGTCFGIRMNNVKRVPTIIGLLLALITGLMADDQPEGKPNYRQAVVIRLDGLVLRAGCRHRHRAATVRAHGSVRRLRLLQPETCVPGAALNSLRPARRC